jgi:hypothetical protein
MTSFDFLWKVLDEHGVIERYKGDCLDLWNTLTLQQQRATFRSIRDKIRAGQFVNYHPVKAVRDNIPKPPKYKVMSYADYYAQYHTDLEQDGWRRVFQPEKQRTIFVKQI